MHLATYIQVFCYIFSVYIIFVSALNWIYIAGGILLLWKPRIGDCAIWKAEGTVAVVTSMVEICSCEKYRGGGKV